MQLLILTNSGTCSNFKALNNELILSSHRVKTTKYKNGNYKKVCSIEIRGRYHKNKATVDDEVVDFMREQFRKQYQTTLECLNSSEMKDQHSCLHIYAHDGTFGLLSSGPVRPTIQKAYITANSLAQLLTPYLNEVTACKSIKLHVCFSGCDYSGTTQPYGEQLRDELIQLMNSNVISPRSMVIEASNGWSILGNNLKEKNSKLKKTIDYWSHYVIPNTPEIMELVRNDKTDFQQVIPIHGFDDLIGKPKWFIN